MDTQNNQLRVKEGQHINKSIFFLTQVIALKADFNSRKGEQHIPYRNSPLTKILRSSLGGNSRTAIVLCITPSATQLEQTFSTLRFGQNAKMIKNTVVANVKSNNNDTDLKLILTEYEKRLKDIENDSQQSSLKLRQIIDNLMREKDELNKRLIKANHEKLFNPEGTTSWNDSPESETSSKEDQFITSLYIWNCGIINSSQTIDKVLIQQA